MNKFVCLVGVSLVSGCMVANALTAHTGHLIVSLTDRETGEPITNATVTVRCQTEFNPGRTLDSYFTRTTSKADSNGVANVEFQFYRSYFNWWIRSPTHYCHRYRVGARNEFFKRVVEKSDYLNIDTNTVQGLAMYNELVQLDNNNDYLGFIAKFEPKSETYTNSVVVRSASFYSKHNPRPMYAYGDMDGDYLPMRKTTTFVTNGLEVTRYKPVDYDMKESLVVSYNPNHDDEWDGPAGKVADFHVERFCVTTNGVKTIFGWVDFAPGCGVYKRNTTGDDSFPTTYEADTNTTFLSRISFECSSVSGKVVRVQDILEEDEYMVLRTRVMTNEVGVVTNCNYSKILGPMFISHPMYPSDRVHFKSLIFNPTPNDPNLEYDLKNNLAPRGHDSWYP